MFCINLEEFAPLLLSGKQLLTGQSRVCNSDQEEENLVEAWCTQSWLRLETLLLSRYLHSWKIRQFPPSHPLHMHTHKNLLSPVNTKCHFFSVEKPVCLLPADVRRRTKWGQVVVHRLYTMFSAYYGNTPALFDTATSSLCTSRMYSLY